jgi:cytochrome c oxidase subunit 4
MNALRLSRMRPLLRQSTRCASTLPHPHPQVNAQGSVVPLSNIEAQWEALSNSDKVATSLQLETLQKKDWKELTLQEKKASKHMLAYFIAA